MTSISTSLAARAAACVLAASWTYSSDLFAQAKPQSDDATQRAARLDTVTIVARRADSAVPEATSRIGDEEVERTAAVHASEVMNRIPGVWISRGSGQEQLTAIRSPVLSGVGACGAFLFLEDGVPIRPTAFCNVNQLSELATELAGGIEVLRGPGSAVHGSNALHGVIDVQPRRISDVEQRLTLEVGPHGFTRGFINVADGEQWRIDAVAANAGSFRTDEGFQQHKLLAQWQDLTRSGEPHVLLSFTDLDQDTAGFISGRDAYRDERRSENANPEAFRKGSALRLQSRWQWLLDEHASFSLVPYLRHDQMDFLQHFNLGQPLEENASDSAGVQLMWQRDGGWNPQIGIDTEFANGRLLEFQPLPLNTGSAAQQATRPVGRHYDYRVNTALLAAFSQSTVELSSRWQLHGGLRVESQRFNYDNRAADGNLRDEGLACGFGGCLFNRPADRNDQFTNANGRLAAQFAIDDTQTLVGRIVRAFRVPQAGELYRLQRGQDVADLRAETLQGIELGWRKQSALWRASVDVYDYDKRNVILRDAQGFNVSDGATRHRGVESSIQWRAHEQWSLAAELAYSDQRYAFDRSAAAGEQIRRGNRIDTAPQWLGGARVEWQPSAYDALQLEWRHQGSYALDAGNTADYPGHDLLNLRWQRALNASWTLSVRGMNLANRRYAERADFAFGQYRYFPGAGREVFVALGWQAP